MSTEILTDYKAEEQNPAEFSVALRENMENLDRRSYRSRNIHPAAKIRSAVGAFVLFAVGSAVLGGCDFVDAAPTGTPTPPDGAHGQTSEATEAIEITITSTDAPEITATPTIQATVTIEPSVTPTTNPEIVTYSSFASVSAEIRENGPDKFSTVPIVTMNGLQEVVGTNPEVVENRIADSRTALFGTVSHLYDQGERNFQIPDVLDGEFIDILTSNFPGVNINVREGREYELDEGEILLDLRGNEFGLDIFVLKKFADGSERWLWAENEEGLRWPYSAQVQNNTAEYKEVAASLQFGTPEALLSPIGSTIYRVHPDGTFSLLAPGADLDSVASMWLADGAEGDFLPEIDTFSFSNSINPVDIVDFWNNYNFVHSVGNRNIESNAGFPYTLSRGVVVKYELTQDSLRVLYLLPHIGLVSADIDGVVLYTEGTSVVENLPSIGNMTPEQAELVATHLDSQILGLTTDYPNTKYFGALGLFSIGNDQQSQACRNLFGGVIRQDDTSYCDFVPGLPLYTGQDLYDLIGDLANPGVDSGVLNFGDINISVDLNAPGTKLILYLANL